MNGSFLLAQESRSATELFDVVAEHRIAGVGLYIFVKVAIEFSKYLMLH